jgi:hypothetical protein
MLTRIFPLAVEGKAVAHNSIQSTIHTNYSFLWGIMAENLLFGNVKFPWLLLLCRNQVHHEQLNRLLRVSIFFPPRLPQLTLFVWVYATPKIVRNRCRRLQFHQMLCQAWIVWNGRAMNIIVPMWEKKEFSSVHQFRRHSSTASAQLVQ